MTDEKPQQKNHTGRPRKHFEETKTHSISTTEEGWEGFLGKAKKLGIDSRSEFVDLIGKGNYEIVLLDDLRNKIFKPLGIENLDQLYELISKGSVLDASKEVLDNFQEQVVLLSQKHKLSIMAITDECLKISLLSDDLEKSLLRRKQKNVRELLEKLKKELSEIREGFEDGEMDEEVYQQLHNESQRED